MTERMEPAELNKRLAGLLGVDLGGGGDILNAIAPTVNFAPEQLKINPGSWGEYRSVVWNGNEYWLQLVTPVSKSAWVYWSKREGQPYQADLEAHVANWRREPPNYAGDLQAAFGLGEEMRKRGIAHLFDNELKYVTLHSDDDVRNGEGMVFSVTHATAFERALAAFRAMGGEE